MRVKLYFQKTSVYALIAVRNIKFMFIGREKDVKRIFPFERNIQKGTRL